MSTSAVCYAYSPLNHETVNHGSMNFGSMNFGIMNSGSMNFGIMNSGSMNSGIMNRNMNHGSINHGNMNRDNSFHHKIRMPLGPLDTLFSFSQIFIVLLMIAVLGSALAVVYVQHLNRTLHIQLQKSHELRDALHVEWSQLLLEQGTYGSDVRVERVAQEHLNMIMPKQEQVLVIRP